MLNVVISSSSIWVGIVYWVFLSESFFGIRYLYLWYNQTISVSNDWVDGSRPCVVFFANWYCFHNHVSLAFGMVMRCLPLSSYIWATSNCVWIVSEFVSMSFSGLHSLIEMCASGIIVDGVTYLVSRCTYSSRHKIQDTRHKILGFFMFFIIIIIFGRTCYGSTVHHVHLFVSTCGMNKCVSC
jgi:hypothetical protein